MCRITLLTFVKYALVLAFILYQANGALIFYRSPYTAHIAENYTFNFLFYIDGQDNTEPICGITQISANSSCRSQDAANAFLIADLSGSAYSITLGKPQNLKDLKLFGMPTYEVSLSIKPPTPVEVLPTPPQIIFPPSMVTAQTTAQPQSTTPRRGTIGSFVALPDYNFLVALFCCLPSNSSNSSNSSNASHYLNETTIKLKPVLLEKAVWTSESDRTTFRRFANPAHIERTTCACNLRVGFCDTLCCCDDSCSEIEKLSFGCSGNVKKYPLDQPPQIPTPPYDCADLLTGDRMPYPPVSLFNPFPHAWLCVMYRNTAYLGEHFSDLDYDSINEQKYFGKRKKLVPGNLYYSNSEFISNGYKQGTPLLAVSSTTSLPKYTSSVVQMQSMPLRAALFFPGRGPDGRCLRNVPIRFLSKSDTVYCSSVLISYQQCRTEFSQSRYIPVPNTIIARTDRSGNAEKMPRLPCNCFVQAFSVTQKSTEPCQFSNDTFCLPRSATTFTQPDTLRCSCSATDITKADVVETVNNETLSWYCTNVVTSVELNFGWLGNGTDSTASKVSVTLAERISPGEITEQKFSVKFVSSPSSSATNRPSPLSEPWKWYRQGDPVKYLPEPPEASKACNCLSPLPIRFGSGSFSACPFSTSRKVFDDCDNLRGMAIAALRRMIPAELISKVALPSPISQSQRLDANPSIDWVKVAKLRRFPPVYPDCERSRVQQPSAENPVKLGRYAKPIRVVENFKKVSTALDVAGTASWDIFCSKQPGILVAGEGGGNNETQRSAQLLWAAICGTKRICERVPSAIQLTIFRSIAGARNGTIQNEIIGAALSFSVRDWFLEPNRSVQQTYLTASVKFISVPATPPKPTFFERLVSMTTAWDILYPIKGAIDPDDARPIAAATGIGLLLVAVLKLAPPR